MFWFVKYPCNVLEGLFFSNDSICTTENPPDKKNISEEPADKAWFLWYQWEVCYWFQWH